MPHDLAVKSIVTNVTDANCPPQTVSTFQARCLQNALEYVRFRLSHTEFKRTQYTVTMFVVDVSPTMGNAREIELPATEGEVRTAQMSNLQWSLQYVMYKIKKWYSSFVPTTTTHNWPRSSMAAKRTSVE